jgi:hypothetical protein
VGDHKEPPVVRSGGVSRQGSRHLGVLNNEISAREVAVVAAELSSLSICSTNQASSTSTTVGDAGLNKSRTGWDGCEDVGWGEGGVRIVRTDNGNVVMNSGNTAAVSLTLKCCVEEDIAVQWDAVLVDGGRKLLVSLPEDFLASGSRESLVNLLDYAEKKLKCSHVIVYFSKSRKDRQDVVRMFMYLGFTSVDPGPHHLVSFNAPDHLVYMLYEIDLCSDDDDDDNDDDD